MHALLIVRTGPASPVFVLVGTWRRVLNGGMQPGYKQFCPVAKASEVFANRWTPLILRELMAGMHSFNDIHRGVPLMSRAMLVTRLRELEHQGIVERRPRADRGGHDYVLTAAGEAFRSVIAALGHWGLAHARDRITPADLDPSLLLWSLRRRVDLHALPQRRIVVQFEFIGVPARYAKRRILWLILQPAGAELCVKNPGHEVDVIVRASIADFIAVHLGHATWREMATTKFALEGDRRILRELPAWLRLDKVLGRDLPIVAQAAPHASTR